MKPKMRLIPGKTKVRVELFKGVSLTDMIIALVAVILIVFVITSTLPGKVYMVIGIVILAAVLLVRLDTEPNYMYLLHILRFLGYKHTYEKNLTDGEIKRKNQEGEKEFALDIMAGSTAGHIADSAPEGSYRGRYAELFDDEDEEDEPDGEYDEEPEEYEEDGEEYSEEDGESIDEPEEYGEEEYEEEYSEEIETENGEEEEAPAATEEKSEAAKNAETESRAAADRKRLENAVDMSEIIAFTDIKDDYIEYGKGYFGVAIEIAPVEFRFFSPNRRNNSIENALGRVLRLLPSEYAANIVKIERPVIYDEYLANEYKKLDELKATYERGIINERELQARVEILYDRIYELRSLCFEKKVVQPFYYLVLFDSNKTQLENSVRNALTYLTAGEMHVKRLNSKELAVFLKYTFQLDFDEREVENIAPEDYAAWAMPESVVMTPRTVKVGKVLTHNMRVVSYPSQVGDAWLAGVMSIPGTKVTVKCRPMDRTKAVRSIDRSLQELRGQYISTGVDSKKMELQYHIDTLSSLLALLQGDNESLLEVNVYVTAYDIVQTEAYYKEIPENSSLARVTNMKRVVRRIYQESNLRLNNMEFEQVEAFIGAQVSGWDPLFKDGRGMPSNSIAACYPWIYSHVSDVNGIHLGSSDGVPVFIDFFRRDSERVNSNMVIVGKSGSGKSYATKSLLANLASENSKIFILDPENEYSELAQNLHGKFINVGNAQFGRLNPFHIITSLSDDESDGTETSGSYATHLQFLEEFFRQILPDCEKDAMEYLNSLVDRMYTNKGITAETNLSLLRPEDYPTFDDLYDAILSEFQSTESEYIRTMLRTLMNYISKFSSGGRNAQIWNGPSSVTTEENFTVFNFQSLLANRNGAIANAQMLLVLKYIDNEIIKNRDYNTKYSLNRKIVVVIDEAHVFIDTKYPVALDFMFQLAKRIRKYNGMQIVITQNIKDFVGSEEIARKSTAIINACQYSFIFALSPNDMDDLCTLYEKAGGINENEQEQIASAPRGQAFTVMSPQSRSSFSIDVPQNIVSMFEDRDFTSRYFTGEQGWQYWEDFVGESRARRVVKNEAALPAPDKTAAAPAESGAKHVMFVEMSGEDYDEQLAIAAERERIAKERAERERAEKEAAEKARAAAFVRAENPEEYYAPAVQMPIQPTPIQPMPVQTVPVQTVPVQTAAAGTTTEQILSDLLARFSHDSLMSEIRRSVREEVEKELGAVRAAAEPAAAPVFEPEKPEEPISELVSEPPETVEETMPVEEDIDGEPDTDVSDSFLSDLLFGSSQSDPLFGDVISDDGEAPQDEAPEFDLMQIIMQQAENMSDVSPIEMMEDYGDTELEITLEELCQYNEKQRRKRAKGETAW